MATLSDPALPVNARLEPGAAFTSPSGPPSGIGLAVSAPVAVPPMFIECVSIIHAMFCELMLTSGAEISCCGPMMTPISLV